MRSGLFNSIQIFFFFEVRNPTRINSASSAVSNFSVGREHHENVENFHHNQSGTTNRSNKNSRASTPSIQAENKAFDVITEQKNPSRRSSFDYIVSESNFCKSLYKIILS